MPYAALALALIQTERALANCLALCTAAELTAQVAAIRENVSLASRSIGGALDSCAEAASGLPLHP